MDDALTTAEAYLAQRQRERRLADAAPDLLELAKLFEKAVEYEIRRSAKSLDAEGTRLKQITLNLIRQTIAKAESV